MPQTDKDIQSKSCQSCKEEFVIESDDIDFYNKIDVPAPTWCPRCRNIRRLAWREYQSLYKDICDFCGKDTISLQDPDGPFKVYCHDCWFSDNWDSMDYGREYDFSRPFFEQYRELMESVPRPALTGRNMTNSSYCNACISCKNCYFSFWSLYSEDSQYTYGLHNSRYAYDAYVTDNSDHTYETLHVNKLFKTSFAYFSDDCLDSSFLYDCLGCSDCFGCINLRKKKYCLWNEQLSKEEYEKRRKEWDLGSYAKLSGAKEKFSKLYLETPHKYAHIINSVNSTGDLVRDAKNCRQCFTVLDNIEDCKYIYGGGLNLKDSWDVSAAGDKAELLYEATAITGSERCFFSSGCNSAHNVRYCDWSNFSDLFGCVAVRKKQYCILNKQYTKEEYEAMVPRIIQHMNDMPYIDKLGREYRYGEFFPPELSAYAYNDSTAMTWYPKNKKEVLSQGYAWKDKNESRAYKITLASKDLPDHIKDVKDSILQETIGCAHEGSCEGCAGKCTTAFKITPQELSFYRTMNLALPRLCPNCRFWERLSWRTRYDLYDRDCMCLGSDSEKNKSAHFHGQKKCPNEFKTSYSEDRPEILYCDECYKAEFL